jgi:hypothetical protein
VSVMAGLRAVVRAVRPVDPEFAAALARRWAELPETARTPGQMLGRHGGASATVPLPLPLKNLRHNDGRE